MNNRTNNLKYCRFISLICPKEKWKQTQEELKQAEETHSNQLKELQQQLETKEVTKVEEPKPEELKEEKNPQKMMMKEIILYWS